MKPILTIFLVSILSSLTDGDSPDLIERYPALEPYFAWKGQIACTRSIAPGPELFGPELKNEVLDFFEKLIPLYEYFNRFKV